MCCCIVNSVQIVVDFFIESTLLISSDVAKNHVSTVNAILGKKNNIYNQKLAAVSFYIVKE